MDLGTIVGLPMGLACIVIAILIDRGDLLAFISPTSIFITIGGSLCALFVSHPMNVVLNIPQYFKISMNNPPSEEGKIITMLVTFSEKARREGLLALEDDLEQLEDEFLKKGIQLVVDGTDPEIIKSILYNDLNQIQARHQNGIKLTNDWGKLAPAWGMIGTLYGLVIMLKALGADPTAIGAGMSAALITTFYGAIMSNLIFIPLTSKLEGRDANETLIKEIMIEGILSIQSGDNPRIVEEKLISFLAPKVRESVRTEQNK